MLALVLAGVLGCATFVGYGLFKNAPYANPGGSINSHSRAISDARTPSTAALTVENFYDRLGKGRWSEAMSFLSPKLRGDRSEAQFASGYATTTKMDVRIADTGDNRTAQVYIDATDEYPDGVRRNRTFHVKWTLAESEGKLLLDSANL